MEKTSKPSIITYHKKTITSGGVIEQFIFGRLNIRGTKMSDFMKEKIRLAKIEAKKNRTEADKIKNRRLSMLRAKNTLTRLINSNVYQYFNTKGRPYPPIFLTLTFVKDIRNQQEANEQFSHFIKRLNYLVNKKKSNPLKYSVVVEFQDLTREGVIHYHVLLYDLPRINAKTIQDIWRGGGIHIKAVGHIKSMSKYVTKYMSKNFEDARLDGHKRYFSSRGLYKPKTYAGNVAYDLIKHAIPKNTSKEETSFVSERKGKITKTVYTLGNKETFQNILDLENLKKIQRYDIS
jgi:hypothetical protein